MWVLRVCALVPLLAASSCIGGRLIAVGLDGNGRAVAATFNERIYARRVKQAMLEVNDAVLTAAADVPSVNGNGEQDWDLQVIAVGINVRADMGFGPFRLGVAPGIRAFFASTDTLPPLP